MKTYKIRSLFFLLSFIFAAVVYHNFEEQLALEQAFKDAQAADLIVEDDFEEQEKPDTESDTE